MTKLNCYFATYVSVLILALLTISACETSEIDGRQEEQMQIDDNYFIRTFEERIKGKPISYVLKEQGKLNAIKKAYQLTEFPFMPVGVIESNHGRYEPYTEYKGVIYSSVKEIGTYVGNNVSFYTFATAIRNPRSKIYTEKLDEYPYHGINCRAYYGTVCSSLVSYALNIIPSYGSYDFGVSELFDEVNYTSPEDVEVADVLWLDTHVAIITDLTYSKNGKVQIAEISEAISSGSIRRQYNRNEFDDRMLHHFQKVYRYKYIENNTSYESHPDLVPICGETPIPIFFEDKICVDKGDRSNYLIGEDVTINVFSAYDSVVVYNDTVRYSSVKAGEIDGDITLYNLPFGNYSAKLWKDNKIAETSWIVVDYEVSYNPQEQVIYFKSKNSIPYSVRMCSISGGRGMHPTNELLQRVFTEEEVKSCHIYVPSDKIIEEKYNYVQIKFKTKNGIVSTRPLRSVE